MEDGKGTKSQGGHPTVPLELDAITNPHSVQSAPSPVANDNGKDNPQDTNPATSAQNEGKTTTTTMVSNDPPYTVFTHSTRRWIIFFATVSSFVSPMTATIYYPILDHISRDLRVDIALINLTITSYMVFQAIAPTLYGDFGDMAGRRPALILAFSIYLCANVGLALQSNYAALLVLRMVQSAGGSGSLALAFAMVADITTTSERGKYMGILGCGINIGPTIGPVLGGVFSQELGWSSVFWFCAIIAVIWLVPYILFVPETCRAVVGNGSEPPRRFWNKPLIKALRENKQARQDESSGPKPPFRFPNPLRAVKLVLEKEMSLILFFNALLYTAFIIVAATLATLFEEIYEFDDLELGLCYLPYGAGCCIASVGQGYILDWNYRRVARNAGFSIDRRRGDDLLHFPIEKARLQPVLPALVLGLATLAAYGWVLHEETSVAVPLVLQFIMGMCITGSFSVMSTLIIDVNPGATATASAANNLVRCLMGAAGTAVIEYMVYGMGRGWTFTFLAALPAILSPMLFVIMKYGPKWRLEKREAEEASRQQLASA